MLLPLLLTTLAASPACTAAICLSASGDARSEQLVAVNRSVAPAGVHVELTLENASSTSGASFDAELGPGETVTLTRIATLGGPWRYHYTYKYRQGLLHTRHDPRTRYVLPYAPGKAVRILQGANGPVTHFGDGAFAWDFDLPEGTPVRAAREGTVVDVHDTETEHGDSEAFADKANFVAVLHADGTVGWYLHLQPKGVRVALGEHVAAGQLLGLSGNTGRSQGPHLHFEVYYRIDARRRQTVPVHFDTAEGAALLLEVGQRYTALQ